MALIKCSECGKEVSDKAKTCVNCGNPIKVESKENDNKNVIENKPNEKKVYNIYAILALVFLVVGLCCSGIIGGILGTISFVCSIIGIVKANKIKKETGKRKGIVISIIVVVLYSISIVTVIIIMSVMAFNGDLRNILENYGETNNYSQTETSQDIKDYKDVYDQIKILKKSLNNPNSLQLNEVSLYTAEEGTYFSKYLNVLVDYSAENKLGGTTRKYRVYKYTYDDNHNLQLYIDNYNNFYHEYDSDEHSLAMAKISTSTNDIGMTNMITRELDVQEIMNYINK